MFPHTHPWSKLTWISMIIILFSMTLLHSSATTVHSIPIISSQTPTTVQQKQNDTTTSSSSSPSSSSPLSSLSSLQVVSSLHHLNLVTSPVSPPTTLSFLLLTVPLTAPLFFQRQTSLTKFGPKVPFQNLTDITTEDQPNKIGDFAQVKCAKHLFHLQRTNLSVLHSHLHVIDRTTNNNDMNNNDGHEDEHLFGDPSPWEQWLASTHSGYALLNMAPHNQTQLAAYVRTLPRVRSLLRTFPHSLLLAVLVESQMPFYPVVTHLPSNEIQSCSIVFPAITAQNTLPHTLVMMEEQHQKSKRVKLLSGHSWNAKLLPPPLLPRIVTWLLVPPASYHTRAIDVHHARTSYSTNSMNSSPTAISLLEVDSYLQIVGAAIKMCLKPVMDELLSSIKDQMSHTLMHEAGSKVSEVSPPQVLELTTGPLIDQFNSGVGDAVTAKLSASLKASMVEYLDPYIHEWVVHEATPQLYQNIVHIIQKHVKEEILEQVPRAIWKATPISIVNRVSKSILHALTPAVTQQLKIGQSPMMQHFCQMCFYHEGMSRMSASLYKDPANVKPNPSPYKRKQYCALCHSSAERIYYHNYHAAYYSDYYGDFYAKYFSDALEQMKEVGTNAAIGEDPK